MPDPIFDDPRLAGIYDAFDGPRGDLEPYVDLVERLGAVRVLDIGCGTGALAIRLSALGIQVVAVDPARASLDVARRKPGAEAVSWLQTDAADLPAMQVDVAVMTGNVAQVFLTDDSWARTLEGIRGALTPGGHLVFETRDPARAVWDDWAADPDAVTLELPVLGEVAHRREVTRIDLPFVSFRHEYRFGDGSVVTSDSTLRFRTREEIRLQLDAAGYRLVRIADAPDRPGAELVFVAQKADDPV